MSSYAPGTSVSVATAALPGAAAPTTGQWFAVGLAQRGPTGVPIGLSSLNDYLTLLGTRQSYGYLYDAADAFFASGGSTMWVSRIVGPAATVANVTLQDRGVTPQPTLKVSANGAGVYGNSLAVAVVAGPTSGTYVLQVYQSAVLVEQSPPLVTTTDAVNWGTLQPATVANGNASKWVTVADLGSTNAAPSNQPALIAGPGNSMTGGADDNADAGDSQYTAGLAVFSPDMGPGQVSAPGRTTSAVYTALLNHAQANNRVALLDGANTATAATLVSAASAAQSSAVDPSFGTILAPWVQYPGLATGTAVPAWQRVVPPSAFAAAGMSQNDISSDANVAAAGINGIAGQALGVTAAFSQSDRASLNNAGVSLFRQVNGQVMLYGYTSLAVDPRWTDLANVRFRMQIINDCNNVGNSFAFSQIDGAGKTISAFNGALAAVLTKYYSLGSLFGATPGNAFSVNTGATVNTPATITARQLNAVLSVVMSPSGEFVTIAVTKYLPNQTLVQPANS